MAGRSTDAWLTPGRFACFLAVVVAMVWLEVWLGTHTFIARDYGYFGYPLAHYHRESFWQGEIPLWNPLNNCGLPFLAQWNTLTLYPGSLLYLLFPLPWSLGAFCLIHLFWGGLGMCILARRWSGSALGGAVAGTAFAFNGILLNSLMWPNNIAALGWMPWVALATEQAWRRGGRALCGAALIGAMQMLTGGPEIILLTWTFILLQALLCGGRAAIRLGRRLVRLGAAVTLVSLLSAVQLIPFLELLQESHRHERFYESVWAMPGTGWANLLVPLFGCLKTSQGRYFQWDQYWTSSYYPGMGILALALLAVCVVRLRRVGFLAAIAGTSLVLALGENGHVFALLKALVPQLGFMRYPVKLVVWASFGIPLLAAFGLRWLLEPPARTPPHRRIRAALGVAGALALAAAGLIAFAAAHPQPQEDWRSTVLNGAIREGLLVVGLGLCILLRTSGLPVLRVLLLTVLAGDLVTAVPLLSPTVPRAVLRPGFAPAGPLPKLGASRAMVTFTAHQKFNTWASTNLAEDFLVKRSALFANANLIEAIPKLDGFYSLYLKRTDAVLSAIYFQTNYSAVARLLAPGKTLSFGGLYTFLGVSQVSATGADHEWSVRTNFMPLFAGGQRPIWTNEAAILEGLFRPAFDPRSELLLSDTERDTTDAPSGSQIRILSTQCRAHALEARVEAGQPVWISVAQSFHPNWRATLDDSPVAILHANYAFQAVPVPAGSHTLRLRYVDGGFLLGLTLSWLACLSAGVTFRPGTRARPANASFPGC